MSEFATLVREILAQLEGEPLPLPTSPKPFDPKDRIPWALEQGVQKALSTQQWADFKGAMPSPSDWTDLQLGVVEGVVAAVQDIVRENIELIGTAIEYIVDFYELVYDVQLWQLILTYWIDSSSTPDALSTYLKTNHPDLWTAIRSYPDFKKKIDKFVAEFTSSDQYGTSAWSKAEWWIAELTCDCLFAVGKVLKADASEFIAKKGDAEAQGKIVGRRVARVIIEAVMLAMALYSLIEGAATQLAKAALELKEILTASELASVATTIESTTPGLTSVGEKVAGEARKEVEEIYQGLAHRIAPYKVLKDETGAFNKGVRYVYGYSRYDVDFMQLRLDAHHIIEADWYDDFAAEFRQYLGWNSEDEMDTIALHTEWHIRSGERMAEDLGLLGAEEETSLTNALKEGIAKREPPGGFKNLKQLVEAYEKTYQEYSPKLYSKVSGWFANIKAKLP